MPPPLPKPSPLTAAISLTLALFIAVLIASLRLNDGHLVYALDDPYIHMAMAKHLVEDGVWGVTRYGFSSSGSSPLWLLLLAGIYAIDGVNDIAPLLLNLLAAIALLVLMDSIAQRYIVHAGGRFMMLLAVILFFPVLPVLFCGMEHIAHALIAVAFTWRAALLLDDGGKRGEHGPLPLLLLAAPLTAIRYEGAIMIGVVALLLLLRRRFLSAGALLLLGALPIVAYGAFSLSQGWMFLPVSIALKGNAPDLSSLRGAVEFVQLGAYDRLVHYPHVVALVAICAIALHNAISRWGLWSARPIGLLITLATTLLHIQFAGVGWFHRYEAYLIALGILWVAAVLGDLPRGASLWMRGGVLQKGLVALALGVLLLPFLHRGLKVLITPRATANIYQQQYQMARFLGTYYHKEQVAANDIGAISYMADIRLLDIFGLGSLEPALIRKEGRTSAANTEKIVRQEGVPIAVVYDAWLLRDGGIPKGWSKAGEWTIRNNVVCGSETVSFYVINPDARRKLVASLSAYRPMLPKEVICTIFP